VKTIVFIHGMYMTPLCWEAWLGRFRSRGHRVFAPGWPGREKPPESLRALHPEPALGRLTLSAVLDHLAGFVRTLEEPPVLVGHSMGGLVAQILRQRIPVAAAVAIDSAPPPGVFAVSWPFLKSNWAHINPFAPQGQPIEMTFERFRYAFVNGLPLEKQRAAFERYVVPESRRVPRESLTSRARVDFRKPGPPLLLIAGGAHHIIPASLNRANYAKYDRSVARVEFKEFAERTHFIIGQKGWEEVADFVALWLDAPPGA
jgi:pimeloyl-ACP methyl ester carboxylesterase